VTPAEQVVARARAIGECNAELRAAAQAQREKARSARRRAVQLRLAAQRLRSPAHDLVPLDLAAAMIFRRVYEEQMLVGVASRDGAHIDGIAYTIAAMCPIYVYEADGRAVRQLSEQEVARGLFRNGARELHFIDGRPSVRNLAVATASIEAVLKALQFAMA
jgi:hypothetical protein